MSGRLLDLGELEPMLVGVALADELALDIRAKLKAGVVVELLVGGLALGVIKSISDAAGPDGWEVVVMPAATPEARELLAAMRVAE